MKRWAILVLVPILLVQVITVTGNLRADREETEKSVVYSTWAGLEPDKCASAWLIKRFVNKKAQFKFLPKGSFIKEGIPFDTPDSDLKRDARMAAFGKVMQHYGVKDAVLEDVNKIVWDIEVNSWDRKVTPEAMGVNAVIQGLIIISKSDEECLEKSFLVFDALYAHLKAQRELGKQK